MNARARRLVAVLGALLAVGVLAACETPDDENDSRSATAGMPDLTQELEAQKWRLDGADSSVTPRTAERVTLRFDDGAVSGQGPCNRYFGDFTTDLDSWTVTVTRLATTRKACDDRVMRAETDYLRALEGEHEVEFDDRGFELVLENTAGDRLSYVAYDTYR